VRAPTRNGFGRTIIETIAAKKLRGTAKVKYDPAGLQWQLSFPSVFTTDARA
jgi:two-component sensor histidine kinase